MSSNPDGCRQTTATGIFCNLSSDDQKPLSETLTMKITHVGIMREHAMKNCFLFTLLALALLPFRATFAQAPFSTPIILAQSGINCGIKPLPRLGYRIGRCINGQWEQVSDRGTSGINCGIKPLPRIGYRIGRCINGQWEQVSL